MARLSRILLIAALLPSVPLGAQESSKPLDAEEAASAQPAGLARLTPLEAFSQIWRELETLREAEILLRADELWESDPEHILRAMLLRVGREIPANLTAARHAERLAIRAGEVNWIQERVNADVASREIWEDTVRDILADSSQVARWSATARALGRLGEYEFARPLSNRLSAKNPRLVQSVKLALHDLYLRWFETPEAFQSFWPEANQICQDSIFMETARERDREARQSLIELLEYEPQRAEDLLKDPHPALRAAAATALGKAHNGETDSAAELLFTHARKEIDGMAFQATLEALLQLSGAAPPGSPGMKRLRRVLAARSQEDIDGLQAPVADGLRRLNWSEDGASDSSVLQGVTLLVEQLRRLAAPHRLTDREVLVSSMFALESLASRARRAGLSIERPMEPINAMAIGMIEDEGEADVVRVAATKLLPLVGDVDSIRRAAQSLSARRTSPELRYNLLAALGDMAAQLPPEDPAAQLVLSTLLERLEGDDANLRRRALNYLGNDSLRPLVEAADPGAFVASLGRESVASLQAKLLELISLRGTVDHVPLLIALPNFDQIASSSPASISALSSTLEALSGGDAASQVRGAARLLAVDDEATRILRLREALAVIARLAPESLAVLSAQQNHEIVSWATELRAAAGALPGGEAFLGRLNRHHLPACLVGDEGRDVRELAHVQALLLSDWIEANAEAGQAIEVLGHFERAFAYAVETQDGAARALVLRDRARFQLARNESKAAMADYRALFASELPKEVDGVIPDSSVLELRDLRQGSELLIGQIGASPDLAGLAREAWTVSMLLVRDPNWSLEPAAVRAQDLRDLVERCLLLEDKDLLEGVFGLFREIPDLPAPSVEGQEPTELPPEPEGVLWSGLLEDSQRHGQLLELRQRLIDARPESESSDTAESAGQDAEIPSENPPTDSGSEDPDSPRR